MVGGTKPSVGGSGPGPVETDVSYAIHDPGDGVNVH